MHKRGEEERREGESVREREGGGGEEREGGIESSLLCAVTYKL